MADAMVGILFGRVLSTSTASSTRGQVCSGLSLEGVASNFRFRTRGGLLDWPSDVAFMAVFRTLNARLEGSERLSSLAGRLGHAASLEAGSRRGQSGWIGGKEKDRKAQSRETQCKQRRVTGSRGRDGFGVWRLALLQSASS